MQRLLAELPSGTPARVAAWFLREYGVQVREEELAASVPSGRVPTRALRRLAAGLDSYRTELLGEV